MTSPQNIRTVALYSMLVVIVLLLAASYQLRTTGNAAQAQSSVPAAPTGLTHDTVDHDSVTLRWDDPGDSSITGYQLLRRSRDEDEYNDGLGAPGFVPVVDDTRSMDTSYIDTSVTPSTRYVYRVKARNSAGLSSQSRYHNVDTPAPVPDAPTGLTSTLRKIQEK